MSQNVTVAGTTFTIPDQYETGAGYFLGQFFAALASKASTVVPVTTAAVTLAASQAGQAVVTGFAGTTAVTLPTAPAVGTTFRVIAGVAQIFTVAPGGTDKIYAAGLSQTTRTLVTSPATKGATLSLVYAASATWVVESTSGTFTSN